MAPLHPVVVGFRPGAHAAGALAWAGREAHHRSAPLVVLHAADYPGMIPMEGPAGEPLEPGALEAAEEVTQLGVAQALAAHPRLVVQARTTPAAPTTALAEASADAGVVVVGSRRRGALAAALLGSVSLSVAASSRGPVAVVPEGTGGVALDREHGVVVGTDGSPTSTAALLQAADLATSWGVGLRIVSAAGAEPDPPGSDPDDVVEAALAVLQVTHRELTAAGAVLAGRPEDCLALESRTAGLLVVGSRGRSALQSLVLGSVTAALLPAASCPVLVVPTPEH